MSSSAAICLMPQWRFSSKKLHYWIFPKKKINFLNFPIFSSLNNHENPVSPIKPKNQVMYDPSEELYGLAADLHPRKVVSSATSPRSWFGPNGQYIRELPCPSCRGRGYTPCTECGIERSYSDCSLCNGKGMITCHQCAGDCVIWEESIDERPWEKARSRSPLKVKEDDEVDNLDIKPAVKRKTNRVYQSPNTEVNLKISRSLKSLNAKTGLFSERMKIIHSDPVFRAKRAAAIKKAKGTDAARKRASESMKIYFSDPANRRKRSESMKGRKFHCKTCGREGHRSNNCPEVRVVRPRRRYTCPLCGEKGHNRKSCLKFKVIVPKNKEKVKEKIIQVKERIILRCEKCGRFGHNMSTCQQKNSIVVCEKCGRFGHTMSTCQRKNPIVVATIKRPVIRTKRSYRCTVCLGLGHSSRSCHYKNNSKSR